MELLAAIEAFSHYMIDCPKLLVFLWYGIQKVSGFLTKKDTYA